MTVLLVREVQSTEDPDKGTAEVLGSRGREQPNVSQDGGALLRARGERRAWGSQSLG